MLTHIFKYTSLFLFFCAIVGITAFFTLNYIIKSEKEVVIPQLVGKDVIYSLELLTDLGLNIKVKGSEYSEKIPKNHIIYQAPEPGAVIKKGRDVNIIFSKGEKKIPMPDCSGFTIAEANVVLEQNDLKSNAVSKMYSEKFENGRIITQFPPPAKLVVRQTPVDLLVSMGKRPFSFMMPELRGHSLNNTIMQLEQLGLATGKLTYKYKKKYPKNIVIDQDPPSGYRVSEHSEVDLIINRNPEDRHTSIDLKKITGVNLFRYRTDFNFLKSHIRIVLNMYGSSVTVFDDYVKPNREIWVSIPNNTFATLFLYEDDILAITKVYDTF